MQSPTATKCLITALLLLSIGQSIWIFTSDSKPELTKVVAETPIGKHSAVYEVLSDTGGATVPLAYLYFIAEKKERGDQILPSLERLTPFLVTRQSGAVKNVEGLKIAVRTEEQVYSYSSTAILREDGAALPVTIELTATARQQ